uniref:Uncharacterized protein n=2 Tax=Aegilops tauschii subsp. strangulata TaxID=200361 RepID=A0A453D282_AEGTS
MGSIMLRDFGLASRLYIMMLLTVAYIPQIFSPLPLIVDGKLYPRSKWNKYLSAQRIRCFYEYNFICEIKKISIEMKNKENNNLSRRP